MLGLVDVPVGAAAGCGQQMGDGARVMDPGGRRLVLVQVVELPDVGDPPDTVADDEDGDYGQADLGVGHVPASGRPPVPPVPQSQDTEHVHSGDPVRGELPAVDLDIEGQEKEKRTDSIDDEIAVGEVVLTTGL